MISALTINSSKKERVIPISKESSEDKNETGDDDNSDVNDCISSLQMMALESLNEEDKGLYSLDVLRFWVNQKDDLEKVFDHLDKD
jgi:hypothetical protein